MNGHQKTKISGNSGLTYEKWPSNGTYASYAVGNNYIIEFKYSKDGSVSHGHDRANFYVYIV